MPKVKVFDAEGNEKFVDPVDAREIVAQGGSMPDGKGLAPAKVREAKPDPNRPHVPTAPTSPDELVASTDEADKSKDKKSHK